MQNLEISFNVVAPFFLMWLTGLLLKKFKVFPQVFFDRISKLAFYILLPAMAFMNVSSAVFTVSEVKTMIFVFVTMGIHFVLCVAAAFLEKAPENRSSVALSMFRSNNVGFGLPLALSLITGDGMATVMAFMTATLIMNNLFGPVGLSIFGGKKTSFGSVLKGIATNPMLIGTVLGLAVSLSGLTLPSFMTSAVNSFNLAATPIAFLGMGASFELASVKEDAGRIAAVSAMRLIVIPAVWLCVGIFMFDMRGAALIGILTSYATPVATSTFPMIAGAGHNGKLAGELVAATTLLSIGTLFVIIFVLKTLALI